MLTVPDLPVQSELRSFFTLSRQGPNLENVTRQTSAAWHFRTNHPPTWNAPKLPRHSLPPFTQYCLPLRCKLKSGCNWNNQSAASGASERMQLPTSELKNLHSKANELQLFLAGITADRKLSVTLASCVE